MKTNSKLLLAIAGIVCLFAGLLVYRATTRDDPNPLSGLAPRQQSAPSLAAASPANVLPNQPVRRAANDEIPVSPWPNPTNPIGPAPTKDEDDLISAAYLGEIDKVRALLDRGYPPTLKINGAEARSSGLRIMVSSAWWGCYCVAGLTLAFVTIST